jgi:anti-sigma-K factor RskA
MIDRNDMDGQAAEYVLGTLNGEERAEVADLRLSIPALNAAIMAWEKRFFPLLETMADIVPSADLFAKIEQKLFTEDMPNHTANDNAAMKRKLHYWRAMALAASLAFVFVSGLMFHNGQPLPITQTTVAILQGKPASDAFLVSLNDKESTLTIHALAAAPPRNKDYELWMIADGAPAPKSLGVVSSLGDQSIKLPINDTKTIHAATLAISVEPKGGSPTGAPTGPVVFTGKFL